MSTYTDLKNRVKETITVGFRPEDRVTTQKVRFYNEENEYWGSFSGSLSGKIDIYKGKLSSVDIYDSTLINPVAKTSTGMVIELGTIADQLEELSVYAHEDLSGAISSCISAIRDIQDAISAVPVDTADKLSSLSSMIDDISSAVDSEVSARISSDQDLSVEFAQSIRDLQDLMISTDGVLCGFVDGLSGEIGSLSTALSGEIDTLSAKLSGEIKSLSSALSGEIKSLSSALSGEIKELSAALSGEIDTLSVKLSGEIGSLSTALSGEVDSLSVKLSGEVGNLKDLVSRTIDDPGNSKPGVVKMVDEHPYDGEFGLRNYEMHMISGTIMLVKIA